MRMVPTDDILLTSDLLHLLHELLLEDGVDGFDRDSGSHLRHGEDIDDCDGVLVDDFAHHEAHDFEGHSSATMLHHFEQGETRDVDLLASVWLVHIDAGLGHLTSTAHTLHHHQPLHVHLLFRS